MAGWAEEVAEPVAVAIRRHRPALVVTSLFGVEVLGCKVKPRLDAAAGLREGEVRSAAG